MGRLLILPLGLAIFSILVEGTFSSPGSQYQSPDFMAKSHPTPSPPSSPKTLPKQLYFDLTAPIDGLLGDEEADDSFLQNFTKKSSKGAVPHMFYSTDSLVSDLSNLFPVTDLLDKNELKEAPLYLSFRYTQVNKIAEDRMGDVFYSLDSPIPEEKIKSLKTHLSGIILDFQSNETNHRVRYYENYKSSFEKTEDPRWKIPFPKYAKKIGQKLLGIDGDNDKSLKIGVLYNNDQIMSYNLAQQLRNADFIVINLKFEVERRFPLSYNLFRAQLEDIQMFHQKLFLSQIMSFNDTGKIMFKVNLAPPNPMYLRNLYGNDPEKLKEIVEETKHVYLPLLKKFARKWTQEGKSELILSKSLELGHCENREEKVGRRLEGKHWLVPSLNVQEVDVTPCQLRTMLGHSGTEFSSLVVNEYTWSAVARYEDELTSKNCPNALDLPANPPETYLVFSSGIAEIWNATESYFESLLRKHQTISGWHLSTLVFPGKDLVHSACEGQGRCLINDDDGGDIDIPTEQGIPKFATEMHEKYKIGCLVEFNEDLYGSNKIRLSRSWINDTTIKSCKSIWDISSLIIWQFDVALHLDDTKVFSLRYDINDIKSNLLLLLARRAAFIKEFPEKDVILQINVSNGKELMMADKKHSKTFLCGAGPHAFELRQFYHAIQTWAGIHGVQVILSPAYQVEEPTRGLWMPPKEDGKMVEFDWERCAHVLREY